MTHALEPSRPRASLPRPSGTLLLLLSMSLALAPSGCATGLDLEAERRSGRAQAELDFKAGVGEPRMICGTIAPGPCSSVEAELRQNAWSAGYNRRLRELRLRATSTRPTSPTQPR